MEPQFWHERWHRNEIGFHQDQINPQLVRFADRLPGPGEGEILVPLCGKSRDMLWLRDRGYSVIGVEISQIAVEKFFTENGLEFQTRAQGRLVEYSAEGIRLYCGDFFHLTPDQVRQVGSVYDRAALIAFPPAMRTRYIAHLSSVLPRPVATLLITLEYRQSEMDGPPFSVLSSEVETHYADGYSISELEAVDVLPESPNFAKKGVTALSEKAYHIVPSSD